jgi:molybdate-binding protein/DNA-binding XRE family transcriptional regulator
MATIANRLGMERRNRGWTQQQVAGLAGISRQSYAAIESGAAVPSTEVALRLASAFGRPVETLFQLTGRDADAREVARAAGGDLRVGSRVRLATVGGERVAVEVGVGERRGGAASGVVSAIHRSELEVTLLPDPPPEPALVVAGCDPAFGVVADAMWRTSGIEVLWSHRASFAALHALARGEVHAVGVHLRDARSGAFNSRWVHELVPFRCTAISFALWEQGLLVSSGNPLGIRSVEDLGGRGVRFLNREEGSGSRVLLDERLVAAGVPAEGIAGYNTRCRAHMAMAEAIATGLADAGVGIKAAANAFGIDFVPLETEPYELIVPNHFLELPAVRLMIDTLRRPAIRGQVEAFGGYDGARMGEVSDA